MFYMYMHVDVYMCLFACWFVLCVCLSLSLSLALSLSLPPIYICSWLLISCNPNLSVSARIYTCTYVHLRMHAVDMYIYTHLYR